MRIIHKPKETWDQAGYSSLLFTHRDVAVYDYPFFHGCIDHYLPDEIYRDVLQAFPKETLSINYTAKVTLDCDNPRLKELWSKSPACKSLLDFLISETFLKDLQTFITPAVVRERGDGHDRDWYYVNDWSKAPGCLITRTAPARSVRLPGAMHKRSSAWSVASMPMMLSIASLSRTFLMPGPHDTGPVTRIAPFERLQIESQSNCMPDFRCVNAACHRRLIRMLIQYDREMYNCCEDTDGAFQLGNVYQRSLQELWLPTAMSGSLRASSRAAGRNKIVPALSAVSDGGTSRKAQRSRQLPGEAMD
jgi:hypothetical protein